ncbi:MAG: spore coat polysaccharide biosynthesis protein SpsF [Crocinitomicaceae bacterium]|jgi:spore coat polysaccharide biosynthesis protein SpsF
MKIGAVIIARYNSSRLYGKVLKEIHGTPALEHTYNRLRKVLKDDQIVIATSDESSDDPIATFAKEKGWNVFRGSLNNAAQRFLEASRFMDWEYAIRTNGDNIFIDLKCFKEMYEAAEKGRYDFLTNVKNRTFPKGMSIEIVKTDFYEKCFDLIKGDANYEEHVTLALYQHNLGNYQYFYNTEIKELQGIQLALDTPEDFERINKLITSLGANYEDYTLLNIKNAYEQLDR